MFILFSYCNGREYDARVVFDLFEQCSCRRSSFNTCFLPSWHIPSWVRTNEFTISTHGATSPVLKCKCGSHSGRFSLRPPSVWLSTLFIGKCLYSASFSTVLTISICREPYSQWDYWSFFIYQEESTSSAKGN